MTEPVTIDFSQVGNLLRRCESTDARIDRCAVHGPKSAFGQRRSEWPLARSGACATILAARAAGVTTFESR